MLDRDGVMFGRDDVTTTDTTLETDWFGMTKVASARVWLNHRLGRQ